MEGQVVALPLRAVVIIGAAGEDVGRVRVNAIVEAVGVVVGGASSSSSSSSSSSTSTVVVVALVVAGGLARADSLAPASVLAPTPDIERTALGNSARLCQCARLRKGAAFRLVTKTSRGSARS